MCTTLYAGGYGGCALFAGGAGGDTLCATLYAGGCGGCALLLKEPEVLEVPGLTRCVATPYAGDYEGRALGAEFVGGDALCAALYAGGCEVCDLFVGRCCRFWR